MIASMHQTEHLPWLGFFDKMRQCDVLVLLDTVQFARRDFQNRNRIKGANGPIWLTVPVASKVIRPSPMLSTTLESCWSVSISRWLASRSSCSMACRCEMSRTTQ